MLHVNQRHRHLRPAPGGSNQFAAVTINFWNKELVTAPPPANGDPSHVAGVYLIDRIIKRVEEINARY